MRALLFALALGWAPTAAAAQAGTVFAGCDADRSCHEVRISYRPWPDATGYPFGVNDVFFIGRSTWSARGAFRDCSYGCAWEANLPQVGGTSPYRPDGVRQASTLCAVYPERMLNPIWGQFCAPGTLDPWAAMFPAPGTYRTERLTLHLAYQETIDGPILYRDVVLTTVPEPASILLVSVGLLGLAASYHRKRRRQVAFFGNS